MFIRFRQRGASLYVILAESRRVNGVVRQQHVASLGVVRLNADAEKWATTRERSAVWLELHEIIGKLQIDGELAAKLMAALQARLPYPTQEEIGAVELAKAEDDAQFWETFHGGMQEQIGLHQATKDRGAGESRQERTRECRYRQGKSCQICKLPRGISTTKGLKSARLLINGATSGGNSKAPPRENAPRDVRFGPIPDIMLR